MTIEEIKQLTKDEQNKSLRCPKLFENKTIELLMMSHEQFVFLIDKIIRNPNRDCYVRNSVFSNSVRRRIGINDLKKLNNCVDSYEIDSKLGKGIVFDARKLFPSRQYPSWIKPHYCFDNTRVYILNVCKSGSILSGIAFIGKPFLHSVLLIGDYIIDFNYDLVISKDLYFSLTNFEVLAEITYSQLKENEQILRNISGVQTHIFNFAFEEVLKQEKIKQGMLAKEFSIDN